MTTRPDTDGSGAVGCAVLVLGIALAVGALAALCTTTARADDPWADTTPAAYEAQHHVGQHTGQEEGCIIFDLSRPCEPIPAGMALRVVEVAQCESRWDASAVGAALERGILQVHPIHRPTMASAGLDYEDERARIAWAVRMWEGSGWRAWSCGR